MRASAIIKAVSTDLNDQKQGYEYTTWPYEMLLQYLHEAVVQLAPLFQKFFISQKVVEIEPGDGWQKACDCERIVSVLGESTSDGQQIIRHLRRQNEEETAALVWNSRVDCGGSSADYAMTGYVISSADDALFRVIPPVPRGDKPHYVLVNCFSVPASGESVDVPQTLVPMVKQWMLMRAYAVDSENNPVVVQLADTHRQIYFKQLEMALAAQTKDEADRGSVRAVQNAPAQ